MLKLTKAQVDALTKKIADDLYKADSIAKESKISTLLEGFYASKEGKMFKHLQRTFPEAGPNLKAAIHIIHKIEIEKINRSMPYVNYDYSVNNDIILATIDCTDIDAVITSVKERYSRS